MAQKMARSRVCNMANGKSIIVAVFVAVAGIFAIPGAVEAQTPPAFFGTSVNFNNAIATTTFTAPTTLRIGIEPGLTCTNGQFTGINYWFYSTTTATWGAYGGGTSITCSNGYVPNFLGGPGSNASTTYFRLLLTQGEGWYASAIRTANITPAQYSATNTAYVIAYYNGISTSTGITIPGAPTPPLPTPEVPNSNRWVVIDEPDYGDTTPSTTVSISIRYNSQPGFDFLVLPPQKYGYDIFDAVTGQLLYSFSQTLSENTAFTTTVSTTTIQTIGSKIIRAYIRNASTSVDLATPFETFYNVATNTYLAATGLNSPQDSGGGLTQNECSLFDVGCQFQRALIFLFVPNSSLDKFKDLWTTLINIPPFGYVTVTIRQLRGVNASTTPAWTMPQAPFADAIFTPLRTAFAGILWGIFSFAFYRRLKNIEL